MMTASVKMASPCHQIFIPLLIYNDCLSKKYLFFYSKKVSVILKVCKDFKIELKSIELVFVNLSLYAYMRVSRDPE